MSAFVAIVSRELAEKRLIVAGAVLVSVLPFLAPLMPVADVPPSDVRSVAVQIFATAFTSVAALFLAISAFSTELAQKRLGFYLATPSSLGTLFGGKLTAAILLAALCFAIVLLPSVLYDGAATFREDSAIFAGLLPILLIPLLIYGSVAVRARSWWIALDVAGSAALAGFVAWFVRQPERLIGIGFADQFLPLAFPLILIAAICVSSVATLAGLVRGRASIVQWHSAATITFWALLAFLSAAAFGGMLWLRSLPLASFNDFTIGDASARGRWAEITAWGPRPLNHRRTFLIDAHGASVPVGSESAVVSRDGSRAAWLEPNPDRRSTNLLVRSMRGDGAAGGQIASVPGRAWQISISDSGSRVAVASNAFISVFGSSTGQMLASSAQSCPVRLRFFFETEDTVRLYCQDSERLLILMLNVPHRRLTPAGEMPLSQDTRIYLDSSGSRMLAFTPSRPERNRSTVIADARNGKVVANILSIARAPRFLTDGRIAAFQESREQLSLTIFSRAGDPERVIELGRGRAAQAGMQPSPRRLWVTVFEAEDRSRLLLIDLEAKGVIREIKRPLTPVLALHGYFSDDPRAISAPDFANVFLDRWSVVRVDPDTGEITRMLGERPPVEPSREAK